MSIIIVLLVCIILLMFKPVRWLVGIVFVLGFIGVASQHADTSKTASASVESKPAVVAAKEEPKVVAPPPEEKKPPPVPYAGQAVSKEFFDYIYPKMSYDCVQAIRPFVKYDMRSPGMMWGTNNIRDLGFLLRMTRYSKVVANDGSITLAGDEAEAQNGFGNWKRVTYVCVVDPVNLLVKRASLSDGGL